MESQKIENLLLTSFDATPSQREKSPELAASYDESSNRWEVAIRYVNTIEEVLKEYPDVEREYLIGNYAILRGSRGDLLSIVKRDEVLYMEAAKRLFFSQERQEFVQPRQGFPQLITGLDSVCLTRDFYGSLTDIVGKGVFTAYLDTGIDYRHPEFISETGQSRIGFIWDQTKEDGFYTHEEIQAALQLPEAQGYRLVPQRDLSGHGTHVAAIGSGNSGMAPGSELLIVKLGTPKGGGAKTTELMRGVDACVRHAVRENRPLALNISYGTNYGAHNGNGILEEYLGDALGYGRNVFVVGAGNEGTGNSHFHWTSSQQGISGPPSEGTLEVELSIGEYQQAFSLQIWKEYQTHVRIFIQPAGAERAAELRQELQTVTYDFSGLQMLAFYGEPSPFSRYQEVLLEFIPRDVYLPAGIWKIYLEFDRTAIGTMPETAIDMWIPVRESLAEQTGFLRPDPETTLTIPSATTRVLTVGAFDQRFNQPAAFSGRGYTWATNQIKPDIVAPGVDIVSASPGGGYTARTGTSMATPFVTGAAAMFMEWGIVKENDPYLYGEKIKAYFIKGAKHLPGLIQYPNPQTGWGALCVRDSIPG